MPHALISVICNPGVSYDKHLLSTNVKVVAFSISISDWAESFIVRRLTSKLALASRPSLKWANKTHQKSIFSNVAQILRRHFRANASCSSCVSIKHLNCIMKENIPDDWSNNRSMRFLQLLNILASTMPLLARPFCVTGTAMIRKRLSVTWQTYEIGDQGGNY